jgi:hypothetical protein
VRQSSAEDDGDVTTVMPGTLASEALAGEEPTQVRKRGTYTRTIQRILMLPPLFPEDPDDDAPTEVSDRAPPCRPIPEALPCDSGVQLAIDVIDIEPLPEEEDEGGSDNGADTGLPLEVVRDPFAPPEARMPGWTLWLVIRLPCVLTFRLVLVALKFACTVGLFLAFAAKALGAWVLFRSWPEWVRAWQRTHPRCDIEDCRLSRARTPAASGAGKILREHIAPLQRAVGS